jgi:hypothetical protein
MGVQMSQLSGWRENRLAAVSQSHFTARACASKPSTYSTELL